MAIYYYMINLIQFLYSCGGVITHGGEGCRHGGVDCLGDDNAEDGVEIPLSIMERERDRDQSDPENLITRVCGSELLIKE